MPVTRNQDKKEIHITDIGVTLRTLLAVAADGLKTSGTRKWSIMYRGVKIGQVQVKDQEYKDAKRRTATDGQDLQVSAGSTTTKLSGGGGASAEAEKPCQERNVLAGESRGTVKGETGSRAVTVVRKSRLTRVQREGAPTTKAQASDTGTSADDRTASASAGERLAG